MAQQALAGARYLVELEALPTAAQTVAVPARQRLDALMEQLRVPPAARLCWLRTGPSGWEALCWKERAQVMPAFAGLPWVGRGAAGSARGHRPGPRAAVAARAGRAAVTGAAQGLRRQWLQIASKRLAATFLRTLSGSQTRPFMAM